MTDEEKTNEESAEQKIVEQQEVEVKDTSLRLATSAFEDYSILYPRNYSGSYPWAPSDIDKLEIERISKKWPKIVEKCRYYYRRDPFVSTVINKMVDLAINGIILRQNGARDSLRDIFEAIENDIAMFLRNCAMEYLISGLVIPEISFDKVEKPRLHELGIKRFESLLLPTEMWLQDPSNVIIRSPMIGGKVSYFIKVPEKLREFIKNKGKYPNGETDEKLYQELRREMPEFIKEVEKGKTEVLLDNPLIIRYRHLTGSPYPVPYLYPTLESLKHKRNLRRMDYSIASRVITAIQLIKMGSDEFPLTEDNEDQLEELKKEMKWREQQSGKDMERIFQLFGNHTLSIEWVFPDTKALLDDAKYENVNKDIAIGLGFPRILVTGETERSFTSDPDIATISPMETMERIRETLTPILNKIIDTIVEENSLGGEPKAMFKPINMMAMSEWVEGLHKLYESGNLSREDYDAAFGYDFFEQIEKRSTEQDAMEELDVDEFAPVPHGRDNQPQGNDNSDEDDE